MIRIIYTLLIIVLPIMVFSQTSVKVDSKKFLLGIDGGFNISKFKSDSLDLTHGYKPYIGLYSKYNVYKKLYLKTSASYSVKGSRSISPNVKIKNQYIDINFMPQYQIFDDFYLQAGVSYSDILYSQYVVLSGDGINGRDYQDIDIYNSEVNLIAGLEFRLYDNILFEFNYTIPLKKINTPNFQLGINMPILGGNTKKYNDREIESIQTKQQIVQMKKSVLLVRLKTSSNKIAALIKMGKDDEAKEVKFKQIIENKIIVKAFKDNFDFCEVRFFYNDKSRDIKNNNFDNIILNDSLEIDNSIQINAKSIFIAEFGNLEQDTSKYFSNNTYDKNDEGVVEDVDNNHYPAMNASFYALIIMDNNYAQLSRPFPYYVKVGRYINLKWDYEGAIIKMNNKLNSYYEYKMKYDF